MKQSGSALLIALAFLVLATVLVMAFFTSVTTESSSAKSYANQVSTKQVADSALHCAMGSIREATSQGANIAWASQPGMIRTYGGSGNTASSSPLAYYKLYSSDKMVVTNGLAGYDPSSDYDAGWSASPAMWTDLNSPVSTSDSANFPIIDGNGIKALTKTASGTTVPTYYGYDAKGDGNPDIDGFFIDPSKVNYNPAQPLSATNNPVPMPVKWIYVLRDGTLTAPDSTSGKTATWTGSGITVPSATNPIVARMAFWTDDETSKININTASEGSYWDHPRFATEMDIAFARSGPAQREYNRYPGHPAGVSLSPVLGTALGLSQPLGSLQPTIAAACGGGVQGTFDPDPQLAPGVDGYLGNLFSMTPRFAWGGSEMGTHDTAGNLVGSAGILKSDLSLDRLYASVDEVLFAPHSISTPARPANPGSAQEVERSRFFLTTSSRAPEVNLFNQPKISIWPVDDTTKANPTNDYFPAINDARSPLDKMIAFCSTINSEDYYFTRNNPFDPAGDFTNRNRQLYDYLVGRLTSPLPGFASAFSSSYPGNQTPQIVMEIADYIRGAINLSDSTAPGTPYTRDLYKYSFCKPFEYQNIADPYGYNMARPKLGEVVPLSHPSNGTKGIGRFPTVQQAALVFIATAANQPPLQTGATGIPASTSINPLHPFPQSVPLSTHVSSNSTSGVPIYRFTNSSSYPYPTLYSDDAGGTWLHAPSKPSVPDLSATTPNRLAQTHSGLRYLTEQNPATGAYDIPNPRYRGPALNPGQTQMQAVLFFNMATPAAGNPALAAHYKLRVTGAGVFQAGGQPLNLRNGTKEIRSDWPVGGEISAGGILGFSSQSSYRTSDGTGGTRPLVFYSDQVIVNNDTSPASKGFAFTGGEITVEVLNPDDDSVVQTLTIDFPDATFPTPMLPLRPFQQGIWANPQLKTAYSLYPRTVAPGAGLNYPNQPYDLVPSTMLTLDRSSAFSTNPNYGTGDYYKPNATRFACDGYDSYWVFLPRQGAGESGNEYRHKLTCDTIRAMEVAYGDFRLTSALKTVPSTLFVTNRYYFDIDMPAAHGMVRPSNIAQGGATNSVPRGATFEGLTDSFLNNPQEPGFENKRYFSTPGWGYPSSVDAKYRRLLAPASIAFNVQSGFPCVTTSAALGLSSAEYTAIWPNLTPFNQVWAATGDFDNGMVNSADGPFINKAEEGMATSPGAENPYFGNQNRYFMTGESLYSPNRQVPSPVIFGSLPAGIDPSDPKPDQAWRTLLFCPNPNSINHAALANKTPDYTLLDFFWMPVVEPYAISEPFSTAGKVNMNYQIAPFTYLKRDSAIRGVLRSANITAVPDRWIQYYKKTDQMADNNRTGADGVKLIASDSGYNSFRFPIFEDDTLKEFQYRFDQNDIFRSASEICSLWLYPAVQPTGATASAPLKSLLIPGTGEQSTHAAIKSWWYNGKGGERKSLTGDNMRELPYGLLYPRLTTKSNSFTVHVKVQTLAKLRSDPAQNTFKEGTDKITGEFRGSFAIERYIDPSDPTIPDFAADATASLDSHYRFRILSSKQFGQ